MVIISPGDADFLRRVGKDKNLARLYLGERVFQRQAR
jgi:hypothetical protein